jgi:hypothetical protein
VASCRGSIPPADKLADSRYEAAFFGNQNYLGTSTSAPLRS